MQIHKINLFPITLPFRGDFSHALKKGASADNVVVEVVCREPAIRGFGEAAPRPYVTGETPQSVVAHLMQIGRRPDFPWELQNVSQIRSFVAVLPPEKTGNAAICALETALLDALGKEQGTPISEFFPKDHWTDSVVYGASIHLADTETIRERSRILKRLGIRQVRIKMDRNFRRNRLAIETVLSILGPQCDLRIDANGAWDDELALLHVPLLKSNPVRVVEQPLSPAGAVLPGFAAEMKVCGIHLMADESVCTLSDARRMLQQGFYDMVNVRLSKCGGFHRSLAVIDFLRSHSLFFQIGCQLGESGLLSAAGRALAQLCRDALYVDGSYDQFLLKENITTEDVSFEAGGLAGALPGAGLGVDVRPRQIERLNRGSVRETLLRP